MEDIRFGSMAPPTVPPSVPQNHYSGRPIVQQPRQPEAQAPQTQPIGVDALNMPYGAPLIGGGGAPTNFTHQEAIYNAGLWGGDLMKNFGLNQ